VALPVAVAPPETVVDAVTVNVVALSATVGVPEIVPVAVSKESPAGSVPLMEYVVPVGDDAVIDADTGVIAVPTVPLIDAADVVTKSGVVKVVDVDVVPLPLLFSATVVTEYVVPGARVVGEIVVVVDVSVIAVPPPIGVSVAVYPLILPPPVDVGAVTVMVAALEDVAAADVIEGADGGAAGVVIVDAAAVVAPSPTAFVARVVIVYVVPGARPLIVTALEICEAGTVNRIGVPPPDGVAIISYSMIADPPVTVAAPIVTDADVAFAAVADTVAGAPGTVAGVTAAEAVDAAEPPLALFATTL